MHARQPLARRIAIAFTLMTIVVSGAFSLGIVGIVHFVEENLVSEALDREMDDILREEVGQRKAPRLDGSTRFFASSLSGDGIPAQFSNLPEGFSEVVDGEEAYYAFRRRIGDEYFLLVRDQHEFEAREQALFDIVLAGFLLSGAAALILGWTTARRVMAPVTRLAAQVQGRDRQPLPLRPLADDYADDEVGHLAAAFDSTLGRLRDALERERLFTSDVSHELRTPLMVVASSCELLEEARLPEREREQVQRIARATEEMRDLVQTFLILARAGAQAEGGRATLASVAEEQVRRWAPLVREKGLRFELVEEGANAGDHHAAFLRTVLSNLLRNAVHYTERGAIRLVLESEGFRVEDSGAGIEPEQHERVFQPFVRGKGARGEGLGLGLSLVKRVCAHQGWSVSLRPSSAGGSCFRVAFNGSA